MDKLRSTHIRLTVLFWVNLSVLVAILLFILHAKGPDFASEPTTNVSFERYAIILTLACIPVTLKLFHTNQQKIKLLDQDKYLKKYSKIYLLRIVVFDLVAVLNLIGFEMYNSQNTMYLTIIIIFALFFCYPGKGALHNESGNKNINNTQI